MKKRLVALFLAVLMSITLLPAGALAVDAQEPADDVEFTELPTGELDNAPIKVGDFYYLFNSGTAVITSYAGTDPDVVIPGTVTYSSTTYRVTTIGANAFDGEAISSVSLNKNVTAVRGGAFANCPNLASVVIRSNLENCDQDNPVFAGSGSNMTITFATGVTKVPAYLCYVPDNNSGAYAHVSTVKLGDTVTTIGANAFRNCQGLTSVTGGSKLKTVGSYSFYNCGALSSLTLNKSVTTLGTSAFAYCSGLTSLKICGNIRAFDNSNTVFWGAGNAASGLTVTFASSVTSVPAYLFHVDSASDQSTPNIKKVIFQGSAPAIGENAFSGIDADVYVPANDNSWNEATMLAYGGTLRWEKAIKVKITTQPADVATLPAKKISFKVVAEGTSMKYQWQQSTDNGTTYTDYACTKATLTIDNPTVAMNGYLYRCVVSNGLNSVTSSAAKLTVMTTPTVTTQPADATAKEGKTAEFKVKVSGGNISYQWYYQEYGTTIWTKIKGATKATYSFTATAAQNKYKFRCRVSNDAGSAYSNEATLTVIRKPRITTQPANKTVKVGADATFKVKASPSSEVKFQWYWRKGNSGSWTAVTGSRYTGAQTGTLKITNVPKSWSGRQYRCRVYTTAGTVYTKAVTLTVKK